MEGWKRHAETSDTEVDRLRRYITQLRRRVLDVDHALSEGIEFVSSGHGDVEDLNEALHDLASLAGLDLPCDPYSSQVEDGAPAFFYHPWFVDERWNPEIPSLPTDLPTV